MAESGMFDRSPGRLPTLGVRLGTALAVIAGLLALAGATALPAVMDTRPPLLGVSAAAALVLALSRRAVRRRATRLAALVTTIAMALLAGATAWDLFLTYRVEEVAFSSGDVPLRGSLYLPRGAGPHPAIVLVHGSGAEPRDEYIYYARRYAKRGIAALAYDKRGAGASGGDIRSATYADLAADAVAAVRLLRERPDIHAPAVGLWGLSEGTWVAPLAAGLTQPGFLVLVSPSATTPAEQVQHETGANVRQAGFSDEQAREAEALYGLLSEFQRTGEGRDELNRRLADATREPWFDAAAKLDRSVPDYGRVLALPWFAAWRANMDFDVLSIMSGLRCPVLAQTGGRDPKNDGAAALDRLREALARGGHTAFTGIVYPDAGHGLIEWFLPFGLPPPRFAPGYLRDQIDWVAAQAVQSP